MSPVSLGALLFLRKEIHPVPGDVERDPQPTQVRTDPPVSYLGPCHAWLIIFHRSSCQPFLASLRGDDVFLFGASLIKQPSKVRIVCREIYRPTVPQQRKQQKSDLSPPPKTQTPLCSNAADALLLPCSTVPRCKVKVKGNSHFSRRRRCCPSFPFYSFRRWGGHLCCIYKAPVEMHTTLDHPRAAVVALLTQDSASTGDHFCNNSLQAL